MWWRAETGFRHGRGTTAEDVVNYEIEELGNDIHLRVRKSYLKGFPASQILWVGKKASTVRKYGTPSQVNLSGQEIVVGDDGEGGYLVLDPIMQNAPNFIELLGRKQRGRIKGTEVDFYRNEIEERLLSAFEGGVSVIDWEEEIACGSFGCAFPTDIEEIILKITSDKTEAAGAQALLSTGKWWDGLLGIHAVYSIPKYKIFALFAERVGNIYSSDYFKQPDGIWRNFDQMLGEATEIMVEPLLAMQQSILGMYPNVSDQYLDTWVYELSGLAENLPQIANLANNYSELWENFHIVFPDVHSGNLGYRIFDGAGVEPQCVKWRVDLDNEMTAPSVLCLDLGIASGSGLSGKQSEVLRLNPPHYLKGWLEMIPRL
ncbi:hypothetical protein L0244_34520 [bacterium]|nr:hypothetical protein [bacterium]